MEILNWIQEWFYNECDGDWEHSYGIKIETLDNPGWWVEIDLSYTELDGKNFREVNIEKNDDDWIFCKVDNDKQLFMGACGPRNLNELLMTFKNFVETVEAFDEL